jgi:hypothetical protein
MSRTPLALALIAAAAFMPGAAGGSAAASLQGTVGPGLNISLRNADGSGVSHLDPGTYTVTVDDRADLHNFHLFGPGVDMRTDVDAIGMTTWTVTLTDGTYKFVCDVHPAQMKGSFTVGTVTAPPVVPKLTGTVTARGITLKNAAGGRVRTLRSNRYRIAVVDRSKAQNFHLSGPGVNRKTRVATMSKATWTVKLAPGSYVYRSDKSKRLRGAFRVTQALPPKSPLVGRA